LAVAAAAASSSPSSPDAWAKAAELHKAKLDRILSTEAKERSSSSSATTIGAMASGGGQGGGEGGASESSSADVESVDKVAVFHMLVDRGFAHAAAAQVRRNRNDYGPGGKLRKPLLFLVVDMHFFYSSHAHALYHF
jgi:hypothetical protein